ncbi:MAG: hypothetical protein PUH24_06850 [Prevotellaceae bacterium]|nr:hypothetical protein [Prevotella sp.]MDD7257966.1 hypothetical protein [Prevotellaceae bacterium]MDY6131450.1 hypothetical protein [Prevotella sp.]
MERTAEKRETRDERKENDEDLKSFPPTGRGQRAPAGRAKHHPLQNYRPSIAMQGINGCLSTHHALKCNG